MLEMPAKILSTVFFVSIVSGCALVSTSVDVKPTVSQMRAAMVESHNAKIISIPHSMPITQVVQVFRNAGIPAMVSNKMDVTKLRYTGPAIYSMNAIDALQVVTGLTVLDYHIDHRSGLVTIIPSHYYQYTLPVRMAPENWSDILAAADVIATANYTDNSGQTKTVHLGSVLDDRNSNTLRVSAPYHTRLKIGELIASYGEQLANPEVVAVVRKAGGIAMPNRIKSSDEDVQTPENVRVGVMSRVPDFQ